MIPASSRPGTPLGHGSHRAGRALRLPLALLAVLVAAAFLAAQAAPAHANPFTVSGVLVDAKAEDASAAKLKAIGEAQVIAFKRMIRRLSTEKAAKQLDTLGPATIGRMMASLSIEQERSGPGRYIARLTITFLPDEIRKLFANSGLLFTEQTAEPAMLLAIWDGPDGPVLWGDSNPWGNAWRHVDTTNALTPLVIPLGDVADRSTVTAQQVLAGDPVHIEALTSRYDGKGLLVATARPVGDNTVHVTVTGSSAVGQINYEETITAKSGGDKAAARKAARRFLTAMQDRWKENRLTRYRPPAPEQTITLAIPFSGIGEWNRIRGRLLASRMISSVDVDSLSGNGAMVTMTYRYNRDALSLELRRRGFALTRAGNQWVLRQAY